MSPTFRFTWQQLLARRAYQGCCEVQQSGLWARQRHMRPVIVSTVVPVGHRSQSTFMKKSREVYDWLTGVDARWGTDKLPPEPKQPTEAPRVPLLESDNLFHSFSNSPLAAIRRKAAFIKRHAYCAHPDHIPTREPSAPDEPEGRKFQQPKLPAAHVDFECPDCGIPTYCSQEHWADDYESHLEICETMRQINEDEHDLRSGREFPELEWAGPNIFEEALVNFSNWDTFLYTRDFKAIDDMRSQRQATRMLTYPVTIASVIGELSPYNIRRGGRLTVEGLRSFGGEMRCGPRFEQCH